MRFLISFLFGAIVAAAPLAAQAAVASSMETIGPHGWAVTIPAVDGFGGNIIFPSTGASQPVNITLATQTGQSQYLAPAIDGNEPFHVIFSLDRDAVFSGLPDFDLAWPKQYPDYAYVIVLRDGVTGETLGVLDQFLWFEPHYFAGDGPWLSLTNRALRLQGHHPYVAQVLFAPHTMTAVHLNSIAPQNVTLAPVAGYSGELGFPGILGGGGTLTLRSSLSTSFQPLVPAGVPAWYLDGMEDGGVELGDTVALSLHLPPGAPRNVPYRLKFFNLTQWGLGWQDVTAGPVYPAGGTVHFNADLHVAVKANRKFELAVIPADAPVYPNPVMRVHAPIVVVGDSFETVSLSPPTPVDCRDLYQPLPRCAVSFDPEKEFPQILAHKLGRPVLNFSINGQAIDEANGNEERALDVQAPEIPRDASIVIMGLGANDIFKNPHTDYRKHLDEITAAILSRAPHAKIIYIGCRYYYHVYDAPQFIDLKKAIEGTDAYEQILAKRHGAYIDLRDFLPPGISEYAQDGNHAVYPVHLKIADALAWQIRKLTRAAH